MYRMSKKVCLAAPGAKLYHFFFGIPIAQKNREFYFLSNQKFRKTKMYIKIISVKI